MKLFCKKFAVIVFFTMIFTLSYAQVPDTLWTRTYGGIHWDVGRSVQQTSDSGYIITGSTTSFSSNPMIPNVYLIKTDANGDTLWTKAYGEADVAHGNSVQQTSDKGYIVAGYTMVIGLDNWDIYLIKTDSLGDILWTKSYGGDTTDVAYSVQQTVDQGYIIAGYTKSFGAGGADAWLIKTDSLGDTIWTKTYGGSINDYGRSCHLTFDQGYIITGYTFSFGADMCDVYLIKADSVGDTLWTRRYGGTSIDIGNSVQQTSDGGYIIVGVTKSFGDGDYDIYLIKTNTDGDMIWTKTYGGVSDDHGWSVRETSDNGYIVVGFTGSFGAGNEDVWLIKTDANGDTLWTRTYGDANPDEAYSVQQTADGGYIVAGSKDGDVYLVKTAPDTFGIEEKGVKHFKDNDLGATILSGPILLPESKKCRVFDITGRVVTPDEMRPGIYSIEIDGEIKLKVVKIR